MMKAFFDPDPVIFAVNGGAPGELPGSFSAIRSGFQNGADAVSIYVHLTEDNGLLVIKTRDIQIERGLSKRVRSLKLSDIRKIDPGHSFSQESGTCPCPGTGIMCNTLDEVLEEFPDRRFVVHLMDNDISLSMKFCRVVTASDSVDRILVASPFGKNITYATSRIRGIAASFSPGGMIMLYGSFRCGFLNYRKKFKSDAIIAPEFIGVSHILNQGFIAQSRTRGLKVYSLDAKNEKQVKTLAAAGVNGFFTDDVTTLKRLLYGNNGD